MHNFRTVILPVVFGVLLGLGGLTSGERSARGDDFRIDSSVYASDQKEPFSQSTTIFHGGMVYDYLRTPAETVVFDKAAGRFMLLNLTNHTRAELTTAEVIAVSDQLQQIAAKNTIPLVKFLAEPKFHEQSDEAAGELTLSSPWITYRMTLSHEANPSIVEQCHEFSDWLARLKELLVPGSPPPFGRLVVNAALAQRQATASQVVLTLTSGKAGQPEQATTFRSEHRLIRPLAAADLERVAQTREFTTSFKLVKFEEYRKIELR